MEKFYLSKQELKVLVFWASIGAEKSIAGSYSSKLPNIIAKFTRKLHLHADEFSGIGSSWNKTLGIEVAKALNKKAGLKIKIGY